LEWRDKFGTAGYVIFGSRLLSATVLTDDTTNHLPSFVSELKTQTIVHQNGAYLAVPRRNDVLYQTGLIQVSGDTAQKGLVSFSIAKNPSASVRLGVMLDNASDFTKTGEFLWVTNSCEGSSGKVTLAKSNKVPDWYFFELKGLKEGDLITIHGSTVEGSDLFTIGALTFDLIK
jgi:hypothetical protein